MSIIERNVVYPRDSKASCNFLAKILYGATLREVLGQRQKVKSSAKVYTFIFNINRSLSGEEYTEYLENMLRHGKRAGIKCDINYCDYEEFI